MRKKYAAYRAALRAEAEAHVRLAKAQEHGSGDEIVEAVLEAKKAAAEADVRYQDWQACKDDWS